MDVISTAKSPACARCGNPIGTSSIIEGDRYWHPECHSSFSDSASRAFYAAPTMRKEEQPIVERLKRAADDALLNENWDDLDAVERLLREAAGWGEALQQRATTTESEASALRKRVEELEADCAKQMRRATDAEYMATAYRNMLGETGLQVVEMWRTQGIRRVHFDWGPEAGKLTGEQRAQAILDVEAAPKTKMDFGDPRSARTLTEGGNNAP